MKRYNVYNPDERDALAKALDDNVLMENLLAIVKTVEEKIGDAPGNDPSFVRNSLSTLGLMLAEEAWESVGYPRAPISDDNEEPSLITLQVYTDAAERPISIHQNGTDEELPPIGKITRIVVEVFDYFDVLAYEPDSDFDSDSDSDSDSDDDDDEL